MGIFLFLVDDIGLYIPVQNQSNRDALGDFGGPLSLRGL